MKRTTLEEAIEGILQHTDLHPWYWLSYGEKCYAFATVEAFPLNEDDPIPEPGSELVADHESKNLWIGENGTKMLIESQIASRETQNGDVICKFIALAHSGLVWPQFLPGISLWTCPRCGRDVSEATCPCIIDI